MRKAFHALLIATAWCLLSSCAHRPDQYVGIASNSAMYIAWTSDNSGHIQGQVQAAQVDASDSTKLNKSNASFVGALNGADVSIAFPLLSSFSGTTWTGTVDNGTLVLNYPNTDGGISQISLHYGSVDDYQKAAAELGKLVYQNQQQKAQADAAAAQVEAEQQAAQAKQLSIPQASSQLADAQQSLSHDISIRPQFVAELNQQLSILRAAEQRKTQAEAEVARLTQIAATARTDAEAASRSATTSQEQVAAGQMGAAAGAAEAHVGSARAGVGSAEAGIGSAQANMTSAQQTLKRLDDRIAELRGIIAHDQLVIASP